jgi:hypothetical protein
MVYDKGTMFASMLSIGTQALVSDTEVYVVPTVALERPSLYQHCYTGRDSRQGLESMPEHPINMLLVSRHQQPVNRGTDATTEFV